MNDLEVIKKIGTKEIEALIKAFDIGYQYGMAIIDGQEMLNLPSAKSYRQNIINLAIDLALEKDCKNGAISYDYRYNYNSKKNCMHIELFKDDVILTHSSGNYSKFPRSAIFRKNLCTNQLSLCEQLPYEMRYGILMHSSDLNKNTMQEIFLGVPDVECSKWCNYIDLKKVICKEQPLQIINTSEYDEEFTFEIKNRLEKLKSNG